MLLMKDFFARREGGGELSTGGKFCEDCTGVGRNASVTSLFFNGLGDPVNTTAAARFLTDSGWLARAGEDSGRGENVSWVCRLRLARVEGIAHLWRGCDIEDSGN